MNHGGEFGMRFILTPRDNYLRPAAERLITDVYARHYGARVTALPDTLVTMVDSQDAVPCAAGLHFASDGFFSEVYLDAPIESLLSALRWMPTCREKIFEVTSLASQAPYLVGGFLRKIMACGDAAGFHWAFFTATAPLKALLERMGLRLVVLADAESVRVPSPESWGSYYAFAPRVYAVHRDSIALCQQRQAGTAARV
jgi:Thermostable hemolysin